MATSIAGGNPDGLDSPIVFVVEEDTSIRDALRKLISSVGLQLQVFVSPKEFLRYSRPERTSCLVLEVRLPGISGIALQGRLAEANIQLPVIFITAHGDISTSVLAMKAGAVDFLTKPYRDQDVLDAIHMGLARDRARREQQAKVAELRQRTESLTTRQNQVVKMVVSGMLNKEIAAQIGVSENTVKVHRSHAMKKMLARSLPELVKMIERK
jgi:RNA polymerase sigma factor (sigma-70 family)